MDSDLLLLLFDFRSVEYSDKSELIDVKPSFELPPPTNNTTKWIQSAFMLGEL